MDITQKKTLRGLSFTAEEEDAPRINVGSACSLIPHQRSMPSGYLSAVATVSKTKEPSKKRYGENENRCENRCESVLESFRLPCERVSSPVGRGKRQTQMEEGEGKGGSHQLGSLLRTALPSLRHASSLRLQLGPSLRLRLRHGARLGVLRACRRASRLSLCVCLRRQCASVLRGLRAPCHPSWLKTGTSRSVRVILAQRPCRSSLPRSNFNG